MAVALSATGGAQNASGNPITDTSLTVNAGDSALVLYFANETSTANRVFSGTPTWGGTNLTLIGTVSTSDNKFLVGMYGLTNPLSGAQTLSCPNANGDTFTICTASFKGSGTTFANAFGSVNSTTGSTGNPSITVSTSSLDQIAGMMYAEGTSQQITPNGNTIYSFHPGTNADAANNITGGAGTTVSGTLAVGSQLWAIITVDIMVFTVVTPLMGQQCM